jgi:glucose-6-phosphate 1-epimerase
MTPPETTVFQGNRPLFTMQRENFKDVVVWNPYVEGAAAMPDFEPKDAWKNMVLILWNVVRGYADF